MKTPRVTALIAPAVTAAVIVSSACGLEAQYPAERGTPEFQASNITTATIRAWSTALESFLMDFPGFSPNNGPFLTPNDLRELLVPTYVRADAEIAIVDGWGNPFLVWLENGHFVLVSYGADGVSDIDYRSMKQLHDEITLVGPFKGITGDIVMIDGTFTRFPDGSCVQNSHPSNFRLNPPTFASRRLQPQAPRRSARGLAVR